MTKEVFVFNYRKTIKKPKMERNWLKWFDSWKDNERNEKHE